MPDSDHHGEVSIGTMVPVAGTESDGDAKAVARLLEAHEIPAIVDGDVEGGLPAWGRAGARNVYVPSSMVGQAARVLNAHGHELKRPAPPADPSVLGSAPTSTSFVEEEAVVEEDPEEIVFPDLGEPTPWSYRVLIAGLLIGTSIMLQRLLEWALGSRPLLTKFGVRMPLGAEGFRLFTGGFLHGSVPHFVGNAIFGLIVGPALFGTHLIGATALVWLISSGAGLYVEAWLTPGVLVFGASAGNYGLLGLWVSGQMQRARRSVLPRRSRLRTIGILVLLVPGALTPISSSGTRVAVVAHVVGFLVGFLLGYVFERRLGGVEIARLEERSRVAGVTALILGFAALLASVSSFY